MSRLRVLSSLAALVLGLAPLAHASTWIVAPTAGPGVDFTNLQVAVNAVTPGDVLLVANGAYGDLVVGRGISIFGSGATTLGLLTVQDVNGGPRVQLAKLSCTSLRVTNCTRVVLFDELSVATTQIGPGPVALVQSCTDVRMHRTTISANGYTHEFQIPYPALRVEGSHVEFVRGVLNGRRGALGDGIYFGEPGSDGSPALYVGSNAKVSVALSQLQGGEGGDFPTCWDGCNSPHAPGDGAHAIDVAGPNATLILTGRPADTCRGGNAGRAYVNPYFSTVTGAVGRAVRVAAFCDARVSGATFTPGGVGYSHIPSGPAIVSAGSLSQPVPADPSLELFDSAHAPGDIVTFAVHAEPGSSVRLRFGRRPIVEDLPLSAEDRLVENLRAYNLGVVPPSGDVFATILLRESAPVGALNVFQAACVETSGATEMSQSWPAVLR